MKIHECVVYKTFNGQYRSLIQNIGHNRSFCELDSSFIVQVWL